MIRKIALLIGAILIIGNSYTLADDSIKGYIIDDRTGQPISGASIIIEGTSTGTVSDQLGNFEIKNPNSDNITLVISRIGYNKINRKINPATLDNRDLTIRLVPDLVQIKSVNVTASRFAEESFETPLSISVTSNDQFAERTFSTTAEVLREEPAILVQKTTAGHGAPIIRGLIGSHVLLLYNGIRLNRPTFRLGGNQYLNTIDLSELDRIEVVRGPSSVMYGSDALGGAINLIPNLHPIAGQILSLEPKVSAAYSSADNGYTTNINLTGTKNPIATFFNVNYKQIGDLRAGGSIGEQKPTGWDEYNLTGKVYYLMNESNSIFVDYLATRQSDVPRYDKYVNGDNEQYIYDPQNRDLLGITYRYHNENSKISELKTNVSYSFEKEGRIEQKTGSSKIFHSLDKLTTLGTYLQTAINLSTKSQLALGSEYYQDEVRSETINITDDVSTVSRPTYPDKSKYYQTGIFIQHNWQIIEHIRLLFGLRYSNIRLESPLEEPYGTIDETYDDITGSIAATINLTPIMNLTARYARGFRAPSLNDVAVLKTSSSGIDVPSVGLNPEYSDNIEIGLKINSDKYTGNLFAYYNILSDMIDRTPGSYNGMTIEDLNDNGIQDDGEASYYQRKNVTSAYIYGIEYDGHLIVNDYWAITANFFYTYGQNDTDNEPMSRIPPFMGLLGIRYNRTPNNWYEIYTRAAGRQDRLSTRDLDDSRINNNGTPGWMILNFRTNYKFSDFGITVALENIFDQSYKEHGSGIYSPGRNLVVHLTYGR